MRQNTEWGYIDWQYLPDKDNPRRWFSVGISTILPGKRQHPHIHYSNEQVLYALSGEVISKINGSTYRLKQGDYVCIEADSTHEAYNPGPEPFSELMVTNPLPEGDDHSRGITRAMRRNLIDPELDESNRRRLYEAVEKLKDGVLGESRLPYFIFDERGDVAAKNGKFPAACSVHCDPQQSPGDCPCLSCPISDFRSDGSALSYICPYGMKTYLIPMIRMDRIFGLLRGGSHFTSDGDGKRAGRMDAERYDTPYSTEISIIKMLERIAGSISAYCRVLESAENMERQRDALDESLRKNLELEKNIVNIEEKITNLKINHHFLFNTLNCMAGMALDGDRLATYRSIIDLSKMFRYTMTADAHIVRLEQEIEYLQAYLNLQKLRYRDGMSVELDVDPSCLDTPVPFNFLQPVAENAFTHSFMNYDYDKHIEISVKKDGARVCISIRNNGIPPREEDLEGISMSWASGSGHGLSLIYDKLRACYGENFSAALERDEESRTVVRVCVPEKL